MPFLANVVRGRNVPPERLRRPPRTTRTSAAGARCPRSAGRSWRRSSGSSRRTGRGCRSTSGTATGTRSSPTRCGQMRTDGVARALAFFTSAYGSYSGCRQYLEDVARAARRGGGGSAAGRQAARVLQPPRLRRAARRASWAAAFERARRSRGAGGRASSSPPTACRARWRPRPSYEAELGETASLVAARARPRGGLLARLPEPQRRARASRGWSPTSSTTCARSRARERRTSSSRRSASCPTTWRSSTTSTSTRRRGRRSWGSTWCARATVGTHPRFVRMIRELVEERVDGQRRRTAASARAGRLPTRARPAAASRPEPRA